MQKLYTFLVTFQVLYGPKLITAVYVKDIASKWLLTSDFQPSELANLKPEVEHQLLLNSLVKRRLQTVKLIIQWRLYAKFAGIEFFYLGEDENDNRENTAILEAAFEHFKKVPYQQKAKEIIQKYLTGEVINSLIEKTGDLGKTFTAICTAIDKDLMDETVYSTLKDQYKTKYDLKEPYIIHLYDIPKTEDNFRILLTEFANVPQLKEFLAHLTFFMYYETSEEEQWPAKYIITELAKVPGKLEIVQRIYDESIQKLTSLIGDLHPANIEFTSELGRDYTNTMAPILYYELRKSVMADAGLKMGARKLLEEHDNLLSQREDENENRENTAILEAAFEYFKKVPYQQKAKDIIQKYLTGEFANVLQFKEFLAHLTFFMYYETSEEKQWPAKYIITELAKVPGKLEIVQKIYDESIQALTSLIGDVHPANIGFTSELGRDYTNTMAPILYYELKKRVMADADLETRTKKLLEDRDNLLSQSN
ncbi:hypothetical protein V9T40_005716 [Parthenolecanium corni]|uniref:Uncharacterized protein n=1 Tax=Parthenolecanium corni TaxID=536013 RepID=A0AAN9TT22_9HEMI